MKQVIFKSLLDDEEPLQLGILNKKTGFVDCLCGCNGCFEPGDYIIIRNKRNKWFKRSWIKGDWQND